MFVEHVLFFGWVEAFATMGVVAALAKQDSRAARDEARVQAATLAVGRLRRARAPHTDRRARAGHGMGRVGRRGVRSPNSAFVPAGLEQLERRCGAPRFPTTRPAFIQNPLLGLPRSRRSSARRSSSASRGASPSCSPEDDAGDIRRRAAGRGVIPALAHIGDDSERRRRRRRSLARRTADAVSHAVTEVLENDEIASRPGLHAAPRPARQAR